MPGTIRIICPDASLSKEDRRNGLFDSCFNWIYSDEFRDVLKLFGGEELESKLGRDRSADIEDLHEFVKIWDFRNGKMRGLVTDSEFVAENSDFIMQQAERLGMIDVFVPKFEPDYILPLGGARMTNLDRPMMARSIMDEYGYHNKVIAALSAMRPRNDSPEINEKGHWAGYAPEAKTEYEAISCGLEKAFGVHEYSETVADNDNIKLCSAVRTYKGEYKGSSVYSLAAPSSDPDKRFANSFDTFMFFEDRFGIEKGKKLLLVTSSIYVPYQYLAFMKLAVNNELDADIIGSFTNGSKPMSKPSNYLQEMKGTIDAIYNLYTDPEFGK